MIAAMTCTTGSRQRRRVPLLGIGVVSCCMTLTVVTVGCRPGDVLSVPPPAGVTPSTAYHDQAGAEALLTHGRTQTFEGLVAEFTGALQWSGLLSDEFMWSFFFNDASDAGVDARITAGGRGLNEPGDRAIQSLLAARLTLLSAIPGLEQYEPASGRSKIGEAFALIGYAELIGAEDYCAGVPLAAFVPVQGVQYGTPLTTDSLLGVAAADFDSAAMYAAGDASISALAAVGLARTHLDRGQFDGAAAATSAVPTNFVYNTELQPGGFGGSGPNYFNLYDGQVLASGCGLANVSDREGGNGLNFVSAQDPRLILSTAVAETCDGRFGGGADSVWYYPIKFGNPSTYVPLATGVEARLIEAEAHLHANQVSLWADALNALRADSGDTKVVFQNLLTADSTTTANAAERVDVMFRERAFWLFGTGTRLGDLRRLIRQYGRDQSTVFPTGPYPNGTNPALPSPIPNYGTDVSLTLPTAAGGVSDPNPTYKGCLTSTKAA